MRFSGLRGESVAVLVVCRAGAAERGVGRLTIAPVFCAAVLPVVGIDAVPAG